MKLKIPFINFKNYIVLKCYHPTRYVVDCNPIIISSKLPPYPSNIRNEHQVSTFRTCYGSVAGLKISATVPSWTTLYTEVKDGKIFSDLSGMNGNGRPDMGNIEYGHGLDAAYQCHNAFLGKLTSAWAIEEETGVQFVMAQHIRNNSLMRIPSGILNFKYQHSVNIFNLVAKHDHSFTVKPGLPIVALYPLTEKKLYVESYHDEDRYSYLNKKDSARPYFDANMIKRMNDYKRAGK